MISPLFHLRIKQIFFLIIVMLLLQFCGPLKKTKVPPSRIDRTYYISQKGDNIILHNAIVQLFRDRGHDIYPNEPENGFFATSWKEGSRKTGSLLRRPQRRKYEVCFRRNFSEPQKIHLTLDSIIEERDPRPGNIWERMIFDTVKEQQNYYQSDKEYMTILESIDAVVCSKWKNINPICQGRNAP